MDFSKYRPFEIWGHGLVAYVQAFKAYPTVGDKYFKQYNLLQDGVPHTSEHLRNHWYPMESWILASHAIANEVGTGTAYSIGKKVGEIAEVPPDFNSLVKVLSALDAVYHLHHRKDGEVMFNPQTGKQIEGIGKWTCTMASEGTSATISTDNPYPCDFDRGILTGFASRYEEATSVTHVPGSCRKKGEGSCTYLVQW